MFTCGPALFGGEYIGQVLALLDMGANAGAELNNNSGWTAITGSALPVARLPGGNVTAPHSGTYFFHAGDAGKPHWGRTLTVPAGVEALIDQGKVSAEAAVWMIVFDDQSDSGSIDMAFFNASDVLLAEVHGDMQYNFTAWERKTIAWPVPRGTRKIRVGTRSWRSLGIECSAYYDDFEPVKLTLAPVSDLLGWIPCANTTGWVQDTGTTLTTVTDLGYGFSCLEWSNDVTGQAHYDIAIPGGWTGDVDTGLVDLKMRCLRATNATNDDPGRASVKFLNSGMSVLGSEVYTDGSLTGTGLNRSASREITTDIPANTRYVRVTHYGSRSSGTRLNAWLSRIALSLVKP